MGRPGLTTHRKFRRLAHVLGSAALARGVLELLWEPCYETGDDYLGTSADIEMRVDWQGAPGALTLALIEAGRPEGHGFIEIVTDSPSDTSLVTYRVHDLWHHAPEYASTRRTRETERRVEKECRRCGRSYHNNDPRSRHCSPACRQGAWRARHANETDRNEHETNTKQSKTDHNGTPAPAPAPAPAPQVPRDSSATSDDDAEPTPQAFDLTADEADEPDPDESRDAIVLTFPVVGSQREWHLHASKVAEWEDTYPGIDVVGECRKALAWLRENRLKTAAGMGRFLVTWLNRATDRPGPLRPVPVPYRPQAEPRYANWREECAALHGGRCSNVHLHAARKAEAS